MRILPLLLLGLAFASFAQDSVDVRFLSSRKTMSNPFSVPVYVSNQGEVTYFERPSTQSVYFQPLMQGGFSRVKIEYSAPVVLNRFGLYPQEKNLGWIEVKRQQIEGGLGISEIVKKVSSIGLVPYKGAMQTVIRYKSSPEEKSLPFKMPRELNQLESWNVSDSGTFQTYGGITIFAGVGYSVLDIASFNLGFQSKFVVEMAKESETEVSLKIEEEKASNRQGVLGPFALQASYRNFSGKKFNSTFLLDMTNPRHHELFKLALDGKIHLLQKELEVSQQKVTWEGSDWETYFGIPGIAGKQTAKGHYNMDEGDVSSRLDFKATMTKGVLTPLRNLQSFAYQLDTGIIIVWSTEMNKAKFKYFEKYFYSKGRIMGVKGFDKPVSFAENMGTVVSQIGMHITRKEVDALRSADFTPIQELMRARCVKENLSCKEEAKLQKIFKEVSDILKKPWEKLSGELGLLLLREPALIHAVVKHFKYQKEVYFKFLSEKFQSLEGSALIEI